MSSSTIPLVAPDNLALAAGNNSFVSNWADKRSIPFPTISVVLRGTNNTQGTLTLEVSNVPEKGGGTYGFPSPNPISGTGDPDDVTTFGGSIAVNQTKTTAYLFAPTVPVGCRWIRVRYVASASVAGITASAYFSGAMSST